MTVSKHSFKLGLGSLLCVRSLILIVMFCLSWHSPPAEARTVQKLVTPSGVSVWLVEDHGIPIVALGFAFRGGSLEDPPGKAGLGHLLANMLDEGAGPYDADSFKDRLEALGSQLTFSISRLAFSGGLVTLSKHLDASAELFGLALQDPHLREADFERTKQQEMASVAFENRDPERAAIRAFYETAFAGHPYALPVKGSAATLEKLSAQDVRSHRERLIAKNQLHVVIVGAIDAAKAGKIVDSIFSGLPAGTARTVVAPIALKPMMTVLAAPPGQGLETAVFALPMPGLDDRDFFTALALNHIAGSGNFDARLTSELRVKRGLTYSIATQIAADRVSSFALGVVSTKPGKMDEALAAARMVFSNLQADGPELKELENAKSGLNGAYLLGLDTSAKLADHLLGLWIDGLDADYGETRKTNLNKVQKADADRVARKFLDPKDLNVLIVRLGKASK